MVNLTRKLDQILRLPIKVGQLEPFITSGITFSLTHSTGTKVTHPSDPLVGPTRGSKGHSWGRIFTD